MPVLLLARMDCLPQLWSEYKVLLGEHATEHVILGPRTAKR